MKKVFINYRVLQSWRAPVFYELAQDKEIDLCLVTGGDFPNTKVVNSQDHSHFSFWYKLPILRIKFSLSRGNVCIPVFLGLFRKLLHEKPDIVVCEGLSNLYGNLVCFLYCKIFHVPFVHWGLGSLPNKKRSLTSRIIRRFANYYESFADGAIAYGTHGKQHYLNVGLPEERVAVALNTVDIGMREIEIKRFLQRCGARNLENFPEKNEICYVGALERNKHVDELIRLFAKVKHVHPKLVLRIVGDGSARRDVEQLVKEMSISDVVFTGNINGALVEHILGSKCIILPNLGGLVFSEALVHGIPILAGPADGTEKDFLAHQPEFLMSDNLKESQEEWSAALLKILSNENLRKSIQQEGLKKISGYSAKSYAKSISDFLVKF